MTNQPRLEVADVLREYGEQYLEKYGASPEQRRVLRAIQNCRTAVLGGHVNQCDRCGHQEISYNSCRNRHCPKCQGSARARWLEARATELLPLPYFHVVFTVPACLGPLILQNKRVMHDLLFGAVSATLLEVAANPRHMGARIGFLAVLHTWGQNLMHHPHVHCVVPTGGLSPDGSAWVHGRAGFFLPVRVLSRVFRGKFISLLKRASGQGKLVFHGNLASLASPVALESLLNQSVKSEWVVYAKPPFGGPEQVLKYLARYTHRVAISNGRLLHLEHGQVTFRWKDYAQGSRKSTMTLDAVEFIRRFLLHVVPPRFVRIRYYGFMANRYRAKNLQRCRQLIGQPQAPQAQEPCEPDRALTEPGDKIEDACCPACKQGRMRIIGELAKQHFPGLQRPLLVSAVYCDTS
jgi:hypothetical protein